MIADRLDARRLDTAIEITREHLLSMRAAGPYWEGRLSSSAVATATAVMALAMAGHAADERRVRQGVEWLAATQNEDGGWGDTPESPRNIAATLLSLAALTVAGPDGPRAAGRAREWLADVAGERPGEIAGAVRRSYGDDRTFAAPILAACALAGIVPWREVPALPVELALMPRSLQRVLRLGVVSYALPALIAVGALIRRRSPSGGPLARIVRGWALGPALRRLPALQPASGGFLEAAPLTSFVAMSLVAAVGPEHEVLQRCLRFLRETVRPDGSWPIDTNLSVWVTTNALQALRHSGGIPRDLAEGAREWLLNLQSTEVHAMTGAAPGGWAWTHLPGGVPDADDTAGATILMAEMGERQAAMAGAFWLSGLHNPDGGWPTFCQGWGRLPFDRSSPDITAHAARALHAVSRDGGPEEPYVARLVKANIDRLGPDESRRMQRGEGRMDRLAAIHVGSVATLGFHYLERSQREDGSWLPLWFGSQQAVDQANPVFGTSRVLAAYADCGRANGEAAGRGVAYLVGAQNGDGGWGGAPGVESGVEETAMAVSALARFAGRDDAREVMAAGTRYLLARVADTTWTEPAPIGLYFASLWYSEEMYPLAWTVEALGRARRALAVTTRDSRDEAV